jgi:acyl dehydratase
MALETGQFVEVTRCYTAADVDAYVDLGGHRPVHGEVPEPLINALFSSLLGVKLPGQGTNYLKQENEFFDAARVGDTLTARVEITRLRPDKHLVDLSTTCTDGPGRTVCEGRALVYVADVEDAFAAAEDL